MDNNEAREMDYADEATGPDHWQYAAATAASHATTTELALANLYGYAIRSVRTGLAAAPPTDYPTWFAREDAVGRSIGHLATTTKSDLGLIFKVARDLT